MFKKNGCDFEIGILDRNGHAIVACEAETKNISANGRFEDIRFYPDGINFEFGVNPKCCLGSFMSQIHISIKALRQRYGENSLIFDSIIPVNKYKSIPDKALVSGCNPKLNCVTGCSSVLSIPYADSIIKYGSHCGAHLHHSINCSLEDAKKIVEVYCKTTLCIITAMLDKRWLKNWFTRTDITRIGNYRIKKYGIEWCDLGSDIIKHPMLLATAIYINRYINSIYEIRHTGKTPYTHSSFDEERKICEEEFSDLCGIASINDIACMFIEHDYSAIKKIAKKAISIFKKYSKKRASAGLNECFYVSHGHQPPFIDNTFVDSLFTEKGKRYLVSKEDCGFDLWDYEYDSEKFGIHTMFSLCDSINNGFKYLEHLEKKTGPVLQKINEEEYELWRSMCRDN